MYLINHITGEAIPMEEVTLARDIDLSTHESVISAYMGIKALNGQIKKLNELLNKQLKELIGDEEEKQIGAYTLKAQKRVTRDYKISVLRQFFDEDQLMQVVKPVLKNVDAMASLLDKEARRELESLADIEEKTLPPKLI